MSGFTASPEELEQLCKDIRANSEDTQAALKEAYNSADGLSSSWVGDAKKAFDSLLDRFKADADKLREAQRVIADGVGGTAQTMVEQEEEQSQQMSQIMNRLGG